jgi:hypothetical protein
MRYVISTVGASGGAEHIAEAEDIRDAVAILERHPDAYIYDRETGRVL